MKAVGYFHDLPGKGGTVAEQNRAFMEFCAREGFEADGTFVDTNGKTDRGRLPGYQQLLSYLRKGEEGFVVVVPSIEALGANLKDAARRMFQIEGLGARLSPLEGSADLTTDLVTQWSAQEAGSTVGERVRAAMRRKAVKGEVLGRPPYGYKVGNRRRLELIPEEAVVVRYIFRIYLQEGLGIRLIARRLNEEGLKTRRGGNWSMVSIRDILRNRVYLGTYARFGVRVPGSHPPLVSAADFRTVQDRLNARRTSSNPRVVSRFLLSGVLYCGYCGNKLIGVSRKQAWKRKSGERVQNSYRYYQCESRTNQSVCDYHTRRADALEEEVHAALSILLAGADVPPPAAEHPDANGSRERERDRLKTRLRALDKRIEKYVDAAAKGRIAKEKMRTLSVAAATERMAVDAAIGVAEARIDATDGGAAQHQARREGAELLVERWTGMKFADRRTALLDAVARITVTDDAVTLALQP